MKRRSVTFQVSLSPSDFRLATQLLPHQIRQWRGQVDEILLTIDLHRSKGRFSVDWQEGRDRIIKLAESIEGARVMQVDYSVAARTKVSNEFFGTREVPAKDFRGGPYYSYFFALNAAANDLVLHSDSDIFFGGGSQSWIEEAISHLDENPDTLIAAPYPGPPAFDGRLLQLVGTRVPGDSLAYVFESMSTRIFMLDRKRFRSAIGALKPSAPPALRNCLKALVEGNPMADLPEHIISDAMKARSLVRFDFLGKSPGMWTLHPPYRNADFFDKLAALVEKIEKGEVPDAQRGDHDFGSSMVDWTEATDALARNRWWRRLFRRMLPGRT